MEVALPVSAMDNGGCNTQGDNNIPIVGASANGAALCGLFALHLDHAVSTRAVNSRVRATLKK